MSSTKEKSIIRPSYNDRSAAGQSGKGNRFLPAVHPVQQKAAPEEELPMQRRAAPEEELPVQQMAEPNRTGLPDSLKTGVEGLSGHDLSDVRVQYNSSKPAQMQALAYAQGNEIHVGPGQEKHLPHEAWHVVQQREGRVKATTQLKTGIPVNDDPGLENEADRMGQKALQ